MKGTGSISPQEAAIAPLLNPVTAALVKESREGLAALRVLSGDFKWEVQQAREFVEEAGRYLAHLDATRRKG